METEKGGTTDTSFHPFFLRHHTQGGVAVDPRTLSAGELERLTRKLVGAFHPMMGPFKVRKRGEAGREVVGAMPLPTTQPTLHLSPTGH